MMEEREKLQFKSERGTADSEERPVRHAGCQGQLAASPRSPPRKSRQFDSRDARHCSTSFSRRRMRSIAQAPISARRIRPSPKRRWTMTTPRNRSSDYLAKANQRYLATMPGRKARARMPRPLVTVTHCIRQWPADARGQLHRQRFGKLNDRIAKIGKVNEQVQQLLKQSKRADEQDQYADRSHQRAGGRRRAVWPVDPARRSHRAQQARR